jgi:hypothetical protein
MDKVDVESLICEVQRFGHWFSYTTALREQEMAELRLKTWRFQEFFSNKTGNGSRARSFVLPSFLYLDDSEAVSYNLKSCRNTLCSDLTRLKEKVKKGWMDRRVYLSNCFFWNVYHFFPSIHPFFKVADEIDDHYRHEDNVKDRNRISSLWQSAVSAFENERPQSVIPGQVATYALEQLLKFPASVIACEKNNFRNCLQSWLVWDNPFSWCAAMVLALRQSGVAISNTDWDPFFLPSSIENAVKRRPVPKPQKDARFIQGGNNAINSWLAVWSLPSRTFLLMDFVRTAISARGERLSLFDALLYADEKSYIQSSAEAHNKSPAITTSIHRIFASSTLPFGKVLTSPLTYE